LDSLAGSGVFGKWQRSRALDRGRVTVNASLNSVSSADTAVQVQVAQDRATTGAGNYISVIARKIGTTDYRVRLKVLSTGVVNATLFRSVNGVLTELQRIDVPGLSYTPGQVLNVCFRRQRVGDLDAARKNLAGGWRRARLVVDCQRQHCLVAGTRCGRDRYLRIGQRHQWTGRDQLRQLLGGCGRDSAARVVSASTLGEQIGEAGAVLDPTAESAVRRRVLVAHPSAELYGSDRVMLESVEAFVAAGCRVLVALPGPGPLVSEVSTRGGRVVYCPSPVLRKSALRPAGFLRLTAEATRGLGSGLALLLRARPEVVYVSTLTIPLWLLLARLTGCRTVCHVHEAEGSASIRLRRLLAAPMFAANAIVANSEFSRQVLGSAFPSLGSRTTVVYNGVLGPPSVPPSRQSIVGAVRLAYVGRLSERKGVDVAVSAVAELIRRGTPAELDIIGSIYPGYEWYEAELADQVQRLGLSDRVRLRGFENPVWPRLAEADIALVPSRWDEPFGNTAVEAVLAGRPLIVSDSSGLREAVAGVESAISVPPDDAGAIADAVEAMLSRWPDYSRLAMVNAAGAAGRFDPRRYRARITSILLRTCGC